MPPPRPLHVALYGPVLLIVASYVFKALFILAHGDRFGLYAIPYTALLVWLVLRARRAWRGTIERPWLDAGAFGVSAALWCSSPGRHSF